MWIGLSLLSFSLATLAPGDPAQLLLLQRTGDPPTAQEVAALRGEMGLDRPFPVRYLQWVGRAVQGDLGVSYSSGKKVTHILVDNLGSTFQLAVTALLLGLAIAIPLGVVAASRRGTYIDHFSRIASLVGTSIPSFVMGYLLILLFAVGFRFLPVSGSGGVSHLILPALTLGVAEGASLARLVRASMLEVLGEEYILVARAKGVGRGSVVLRHALRNAFNPILTLTGLRFGRLVGGAVIVEAVFGRTGLGTVILDAIHDRDYVLIQGFMLLMGTTFVVTNLMVDILYSRLDPRIGRAMTSVDRHHVGGR